MLSSFCIKTNNSNIISQLKSEFENSDLDELYISEHKFRNYKNIILHYKADDLPAFHALIAGVLTNIVIEIYQNSIIKNALVSNYFYFSGNERKEILKYCTELLKESPKENAHRENIIFSAFFDYIEKNKYMILDGFVNFRLAEYILDLDEIIDLSVEKFVVEKEYNEFVSLLKAYINSREPVEKSVHIIYQNQESILLDSRKRIIDTSSYTFDAKYLSDITFSSNDYALNALLNLVPQNIYLHLVDNDDDEFVNTIRLIFEDRVKICMDCGICNLFKTTNFAAKTKQ